MATPGGAGGDCGGTAFQRAVETEGCMFKSMSADQYVAERIQTFQKWYDGKAVYAKRRYLAIGNYALSKV